MQSISIEEARKIVLLSQKLPVYNPKGSAVNATLAAINHLGYIQIDTISVVERAHHHTLWNRNSRYKNTHLESLLADKKIFEYWSHAASYLPMSAYRYSLPRKNEIKSGKQKHWFKRDTKLMKDVLTRIKNEGAMQARDFDDKCTGGYGWKAKNTKQALENLFVEGELMIPYRRNFNKVYDLTERVLPEDINITTPTPAEYARFIIQSYLRANGIAKLSELIYLQKNIKSLIFTTLKDMVASRELIILRVNNSEYYAQESVFSYLSRRISRSRVKILSPFDNLVIQRKRIKEIFEFDYILECYLPAAKRKYGYFSLPVLWEGKFVARIDCKAYRKQAMLNVNRISFERDFINKDRFYVELAKELEKFAKFNKCRQVEFDESIPDEISENYLS